MEEPEHKVLHFVGPEGGHRPEKPVMWRTENRARATVYVHSLPKLSPNTHLEGSQGSQPDFVA